MASTETMQRRQEVAEMDWSEIDLVAKTWTLPAERAKNGEAHIVLLTDLATDQLHAMQPKSADSYLQLPERPPCRVFLRPSGHSAKR